MKIFSPALRVIAALMLCPVLSQVQSLAQTWTATTNQPSVYASSAYLMTDGTVLVQGSGSASWVRLTPDQTGSYINGTWSNVASLPAGYAPLYYAGAVLADGRLVIIGGEYNYGTSPYTNDTNLGAIYDPRTNTWTTLVPPAGWSSIGDAPSVVLPNGTFLLGDAFNTQLAALNPTTLTWTAVASTGKNDSNNEEGFTLLPDGSIIDATVDSAPVTQRYLPALGEWISAGSTPVSLSSDEEMGPAVLRPNGTVFQAGASGYNAVYTPPTSQLGTGTWTAAPSFPYTSAQLDTADAPACLLPDGDVLVAVSPGIYTYPTTFYEFDGTNLNSVPAPPGAANIPSYVGRLIPLPNGQAFWAGGSTAIYTPSGSPNPAWAPTITAVPTTIGPGATYTISGTQFNGLSQAVGYGDDYQAATNYPLVRIVNQSTGHVFYARTHDHSTMGVATGNTPVSTSFDVPTNIELGSSSLVVVANGIASAPVSVNVSSLKPTVTGVLSSANPSAGGQFVTFSASASGPNGTPTGTMTFYDGTTRIGIGTMNVYGTATLTTSALITGAHPITAVYSGDSSFASSTSAVLTQTVSTSAASATSLVATPDPVILGAAVTYTATVVSSSASVNYTPTGSVTFYNGTANLGTQSLNATGVAIFSSTQLSLGANTITATYSGDTNYSASTSGPVVETAETQAATAGFTPGGGTYTSPQLVTLSTTTPGASIYYTTDFSVPTTSSFLYTGPIAVNASETISAIAVAPGFANSALTYATYTINGVVPVISTYAGDGVQGYSGDNGPATSAEFNYPYATALDASGNLYIADFDNNRVRKVTPQGVITTVAGTGTAGYNGDGQFATSAELKSPTGVAVDPSGNLYIVDAQNNRIREVNTTGIISTVAGTGTAGYNGDGIAATSAELNGPGGIAVDSFGNLYVADTENHRIRKFVPGGTISTVAGDGGIGYSGDGGSAIMAGISFPETVAVDAAGSFYFDDFVNQRIRKVTAAGIISTVAGNGIAGYTGDGGPATSAEIAAPYGLAVDNGGDLFIVDFGNNRIREVSPLGTISTIAGSGTSGFAGDGGPATSAELNGPEGVTVDSSGNLYIADSANQRIRKVVFQSAPATATTTTVTSSLNPALSSQAVTYTATVTSNGGPPPNNESVTFYQSGAPLYPAVLMTNGVATYTRSIFPVGTYTISATYSGDSKFLPSSGSVSEVVAAALPPQVGYLNYWGINNTGVTISWSTDQPATTQVAYGTTTALGQLSPLQTSLTNNHGVVLTNLSPGTTYYFVAQSTSAAGLTGSSTVYSFTTTGTATLGPPVISGVAVSGIANTSATISWTTDQPSTSLVNYGTTTGYGSASALNSTLTTNHSVTLTGLTLGTTYDFDVVSANSANASSNSANASFTTTSTSSPPVISSVATTGITSSSFTVTWTTDQPSSSQVSYGTTTGYGSSASSSGLTTSHSVTLTGLAAGTTYDFDVTSANAASQSSTSANYVVATTSSNATPPNLGYLAYWGINNTGITVSWSTDVPATTQLAYGTSTSLGQLSPLQTALTASHGVVLTTLNPGTTYYFVAQSTGANGATGYTSMVSFTTTGTQTIAPPVITNVAVGSITSTSAVVTWTTDEASSSQVNYGVTTTYTSSSTLNTALVTSHTVTLTGLMPGTTYDFDVMSSNSSALSSTSSNATFTTTGSANGPVITNVNSSSITSGTAMINWTTDQASSSIVNFGPNTSYGSSASTAGLSTSHSVTLTGLSASTTYDYDVVSANASSISTTSANYSFTTSANTAPPPVVSYISFWGITSTGVTISWSTNEAANTAVAYGTTTALGQLSPLQTALTLSHGVTLTGLTPGTTYYFVAQSADGNGNTGYSTTFSFTTLSGPPTISGITVTPASNHTATIAWTTSTPTTSYVQYGTAAGAYTFYSPLTSSTTTPNCALSYVPSGTIHYQLVSSDSQGNQVTSPDATFTEP